MTRVALAAGAVLLLAGTAGAQHLSTNGQTANNPPFNPAPPPDTVNYVVDDGTVETGVGITDPGGGTHDIIWLNRFAVQAGGERITNILTAFGSPGDTRNYNGIPVTLVLYSDPDGGSTQNATPAGRRACQAPAHWDNRHGPERAVSGVARSDGPGRRGRVVRGLHGSRQHAERGQPGEHPRRAVCDD